MNNLDVVQGDLLEFDMLVTQGRKAFEPQEGDRYFFRVENGPNIVQTEGHFRIPKIDLPVGEYSFSGGILFADGTVRTVFRPDDSRVRVYRQVGEDG